MTTTARPVTGDLPQLLTDLARAHGDEVGMLAGLVLQHRAAAETVAARALAEASRDRNLPPPGPARRVHVLRIALRRILHVVQRSRAVDPHATVPTAELLAQTVARTAATHAEFGIPVPALLAAMAALPARLRALVVLSDLFELGVGELAEVAGGGVGRLERQVAEAEERLRASLDNPIATGAIEEIVDDA